MKTKLIKVYLNAKSLKLHHIFFSELIMLHVLMYRYAARFKGLTPIQVLVELNTLFFYLCSITD